MGCLPLRQQNVHCNYKSIWLVDIFSQAHYCAIKLYTLLNMWGVSVGLQPRNLGRVIASHFPSARKLLDPCEMYVELFQ